MNATRGRRPAPQALPCRRDPDRWFDPCHRISALRGCLRCPARRWCAREALRTNASGGMWAGIWIDGEHTEATQLLRAVAENPPTPVELRQTSSKPNSPAPQCFSPASPAALIRARSSGHCEVMLDGCRYTGDTLLSRGTAQRDAHLPTAAHGFLTCEPCQVRLTEPGRIAVDELGYRVPSPTAAAATPFFWRQTRWTYLDPGGRLLDTSSAIAHDQAS
ncbi:WhiB family transcriptional regulator (plasmid) [Mycolicibacterium aichiense]|uniref:WhiB family transcriptional regulator n=1 Tax=Mycolicibacterium aichiense TaxID=1799 RepID=UPI003D67AE93